MFDSTSTLKALGASLLLMTGAAQAAPVISQEPDWAVAVQVLLSAGLCQNRLVEADRAKCYRDNSQQACRNATEGVEKENCITEYAYNRVPQKTGMASQKPLVMSPFKTDENQLNNASSAKAGSLPVESAPDELDSKIKFFLHDKEKSSVVQ